MKRKLLLAVSCLLLPLAMRAQTPTDDTFTVSDLEWDGEDYFFTVSLTGTKNYVGYNLDIFLPTGITVMNDVDEGYYVYINTDDGVYPYKGKGNNKTYYHTVSCNVLPGNQLRVACASNENKEFTATSGALFNVYVAIDEATFTSSFSPKPIVRLSGMNLTAVEEGRSAKYVPADYACRPFTTGIPTARTLAVNVSAANKIGTLILPFDTALPSGLKAYTCSGAEGDLLTLSPAQSISTCTPYIVYAESGYSGSLSGTATLTDGSNVTDVFASGYLTGVLTGTTVSTGYILQDQGSGPLFYDADGANFMLPAGRCYLTPSGDSSAKSFRFRFDNADGISETLTPSLGEDWRGLLYDLSGRRVIAPARGIYIQGTRKIIVK